MMTGQNAAGIADMDAAALRSDVYALLAVLLVKPPAAEFLSELTQMVILPDIPQGLQQALSDLKETARRTDAAGVQREYEELFVGLGRGQIVPYASWYGERLLMAAPLARLRSDLPALNIRRQTGVSEPEDHAGALCEAMVLIIGQPEISTGHQSRFFHARLGSWMIRFFQDLQQAPSAVLYRSVGRLGERFLQLEKQFLNSQPEEV